MSGLKYNPDKHHRKSTRLNGYDYSSAGAYFVTICVKNRECLLGEIQNGKMILNDFGNIIDYHWKNIPSHFQNVDLDQFIVMPNHLHGILWLVDDDDMATYLAGAKHSGQSISSKHDDVARNASPLHRSNHPEHRPHYHPNRPKGTKPGSLSAIIQNFTSITTRKINRIRKTPGEKLWQRNFHDRIIRNEKELFNIRQYIIDNPLKWEIDNENPNN
jgi:REP element-mobilizing transposase RayT